MDCGPPSSSTHGIFLEESWSGLLFPPPGNLPDPGIKLRSSVSNIGRWILNHCFDLESPFMYMLLLLLSHISRVRLCDPIDGSPPGSHPWDSPGKNTGVGCHFLLQCMKVKSESEVAQSFYIYTSLMKLGEHLGHTFLCLNVRVRVIYLI